MATGSSSLFKSIVRNVAIIGAGSAVLIWWDKRKSRVPNQVRELAYEAAALQREVQEDRDAKVVELGTSSNLGHTPNRPSTQNNAFLARKKWKEAVALSASNSLSPKVLFNLTFALACNLDDAGEKGQAEQEFKNALAAFPENFDLHELEENTRARVGIALDRLAQIEQDRGKFAEAMLLYDRALDAVATPEEVAKMTPSFLARQIHVETVAGVLNNVATLYAQLGREPAARQVLERSEALMNARKMSSLNLEPGDGNASTELQ